MNLTEAVILTPAMLEAIVSRAVTSNVPYEEVSMSPEQLRTLIVKVVTGK